uniref:Uncharacterized protein n=1 Tax=Cyprinus carpio carpio TaxID=630221 RepID=A0A9J7YXS9_CYPCA
MSSLIAGKSYFGLGPYRRYHLQRGPSGECVVADCRKGANEPSPQRTGRGRKSDVSFCFVCPRKKCRWPKQTGRRLPLQPRLDYLNGTGCLSGSVTLRPPSSG